CDTPQSKERSNREYKICLNEMNHITSTRPFRKLPGVLRGCHPTHSWCAVGAKAKLFLKDNYKTKTPCGKGNPFEKLVEEDGCIVCLAVMVNTITLWHYYEDLLSVPYLGYYHPEFRHLSYCTHGRRIQYEFPGIMDEVTKAAGIMKVAKVGKETSRLIRARDFKKFIATIIADDPYCFVVRPPDRVSDDLAVDALQKGQAMLKAWRNGPKEPPDNIDWPKPKPELIRDDCPAFIGYHQAYGKEWPLCKANDRHPNLFKAGEVFNENGLCCCSQCSWHLKF
ncbi:MAG: AAC(3) family N-acetyltransferase, partial [Sedimentisphaerales bacterium]|nr:AAC(3) family N-acetyltransferase [Sedimentisphaerales bacterium]